METLIDAALSGKQIITRTLRHRAGAFRNRPLEIRLSPQLSQTEFAGDNRPVTNIYRANFKCLANNLSSRKESGDPTSAGRSGSLGAV
jgi:hypothetical protein